MQKLLISSVLILSLVFYFGCQDPSPTDPASELDKKTPTWEIPGDFATIQAAIDDPTVMDGDIIRVASGNHSGAFIDKKVTIKGQGNAVINDGPVLTTVYGEDLKMGFRLLAGSDGSTISHLSFDVEFPVMNGDAVEDVTVTQCTFNNSVQAVSNWRGNNWEITHNNINDLRTFCGGGIGILVGDYSGGTVQNNLVSHNKISGTLYVNPQDCGGYNGSGIVLYADFRFGRTGTQEISNNFVTHNTISLISNTLNVVDVVAFELTDTSPDEKACDIIYDNSVGFNDFRGTTIQIVTSPAALDGCNNISRNLGNNRGHGLHPSTFKP